MTKDSILQQMSIFSLGTDGIGGWIRQDADARIFERLGQIDTASLTKVQLNQLLAFGHEAPVSDDFFHYYWLESPKEHPYDVCKLPDFTSDWLKTTAISSLAHLKW